ncbi:GTPase Era [Rickettsiella grylli]|uniref:GTPase Era n=1 Tax=Rickettsiella grylli TaxID=59196 RepID=A8PN29_9COXI|nr:GTPase Era [Rickettsiella grylli]EDP47021.1 GTP-binding protein Era [Rickettsiella grylli]
MKNLKTHCGKIAIIGRPNVGKSTLLNKILGEKLTITSSKPQTTRDQILGIKTDLHTQFIYKDTPGILQNAGRRLSRTFTRSAIQALIDVDLIGFVIEADRWTNEEAAILERIKPLKRPVILIINKVDKINDKHRLLPFLKCCYQKMSFLAIVPISALKGQNIDELEKVIAKALPHAAFIYPPDQLTDRSQRFLVGEFIREKLMRYLHQEIPYGLTVSIEQFIEEKKIIKISALIWAEHSRQKAIIIGKKGELLKKIASEARKDIEAFLHKKIYLDVWIKIKTRKPNEEGNLKRV